MPPLQMVDDVLTASKCGNTSLTANSTTNTFIELKKLGFSKDKCNKIHIGNNKLKCPKQYVHDEPMGVSTKEKYLGDFLTNNANSKETIQHRKARGYAILAEIRKHPFLFVA